MFIYSLFMVDMMKKYIFSLLLSFSIVSLCAAHSERDSLRMFLEFLGEDSITITKIMNSEKSWGPLGVIDEYLLYGARLTYDNDKKQVIWCSGREDTVFVCKCAEYVANKIVSDTVLDLIDPYLLDAYVIGPSFEKLRQILLRCAEYVITSFHSVEAIFIPEIYYTDHKELDNRQEKLCFYSMVNYILSGKVSNSFRSFDNETRMKIIAITESTESTYYYAQFRNVLDSYSKIELARISIEQKEELIKILKEGLIRGDQKATLTYSFMLQTGQFSNQNIDLGEKLFLYCINNKTLEEELIRQLF